jgi:large subunit ribosomal protein L21e
MTHRVGSFLRKSRQKLRLDFREKGKVSLSKYFQEFKEGDKVCLKIQSNVTKGMFFPRFHGLSGVVTGKRGSCYEVLIRDGGKHKTIVTHPIHLNRLNK